MRAASGLYTMALAAPLFVAPTENAPDGVAGRPFGYAREAQHPGGIERAPGGPE
jgi:hypothetical protein